MTRDEEEINYLLDGVDPKYHDAIRTALLGLANWYGDKSYRQMDDWFTIVYGAILEVEDVLACKREHVKVPVDYEMFLALPADKPRINTDDLKHRSRDSWTDQYDL